MKILIFILALIIVFVVVFFVLNHKTVEAPTSVVNSFEECAEAGYPVMESYPRQCRTDDGKTFTEDIGNEIEKLDLIRVENPRPNQKITSPLNIKGQARGYWFFEASFPIKLYNGKEEEIASAIAQAKTDWMTEEFVAFEAILQFQTPDKGKGTIVFEKDNPSGLPENDDQLEIPINF